MGAITMSTRGIIARKTATGFEGNYHHWDSYPAGLGATLYHLYNGHFQNDLKRMMHVLIDEHRGGWSTIIDCDWSMTPGFVEKPKGLSWDEYGELPTNRRPQCYCHGDRAEQAKPLITMQG